MKKILLLMLCSICIHSVLAETKSEEQLYEIGVAFLAQRHLQETEQLPQNIQPRQQTSQSVSFALSFPNLYVVNSNIGWAIMSTDSRVQPILAYSTSSEIFNDDMPDALQDLILSYNSSIQYVKDSMINLPEHPLWTTLLENDANDSVMIESMQQVVWNQDYNNNGTCSPAYNQCCPTFFTPICGHTYVGCTAVAMGQIMWRYKWPNSALVPDTIFPEGKQGEGKHIQFYDWNFIPHALYSYSSNKEADMLATFLRDCGYAAKMDYKSNGSFASLKNALNALRDVFSYSDNMVYRKRNETSNWEELLKDEINAQRPILYAGYRTGGGGHAFVLDGYCGDFFHINWGWGSSNYNNAFYSLSALHPYNPNKYYSNWQEAVFGIEPNYHCEPIVLEEEQVDDTCLLVQGGSITLSDYVISENQVGYYYSGTCIRLTNGFHAKAGSEVHIAVTDVPCNLTEDATASKLAAKSFNQSDNIWCNQWNILSHGQESNPNDPFPHARTSIYWLSENTVNRNGYEYIPLMCSSSKPNVESTQLVGELRFTEEDKQVYFYYDNTEYLLYDFGAQVGDQLQIFSGINNYNYYDYYETYTHVVTRREYLDDGRIKLTSIPFFGDPVPDDINENNYSSVTWIEGVGSEHGIVHNNINNLPGMGTEWLLCAYRDDECRYTTDDPEYAPLGCVYNEGDVINAVESVSISAPSVQKIIKDGQLLILRDGQTYNVMGMEVK